MKTEILDGQKLQPTSVGSRFSTKTTPAKNNELLLLVAIDVILRNSYEYISSRSDYQEAHNPVSEKKRKKWFLKIETLMIMTQLSIHGELHQKALGELIMKDNDGQKAGTIIKKWVNDEDKLKPFDLIKITERKKGGVLYKYYSLTNKGKDLMKKINWDLSELINSFST